MFLAQVDVQFLAGLSIFYFFWAFIACCLYWFAGIIGWFSKRGTKHRSASRPTPQTNPVESIERKYQRKIDYVNKMKIPPEEKRIIIEDLRYQCMNECLQYMNA